MARAVQKQAFDPKVFRHFAAVTLAIAACVALMASGSDNDDASAQSPKKPNQTQRDFRPDTSREISSGFQSNDKGFAPSRGGGGAPAADNVIAAPPRAAYAPVQQPLVQKRKRQTMFYLGDGRAPTGDRPPPGPPGSWGELQTVPINNAPQSPPWTAKSINAAVKASMQRSGRISNDL